MIISLITLGWMDMVVPTGIAITILLLSMAKKRSHALYYIFGGYFTYAIASVMVYLGADIYLRRLWDYLITTYPLYVTLVKLAMGVGAGVGFILTTVYFVRVMKRKKGGDMDKVLRIKSVHPVSILLIGVLQYLMLFPGCFNMFAFIAIMVSNRVPLPGAIAYICVFCLFSILPKVAVYVLSIALDGERFERVLAGMRKVVSVMFFVSTPLMFLFISLWGTISGLRDILP